MLRGHRLQQPVAHKRPLRERLLQLTPLSRRQSRPGKRCRSQSACPPIFFRFSAVSKAPWLDTARATDEEITAAIPSEPVEIASFWASALSSTWGGRLPRHSLLCHLCWFLVCVAKHQSCCPLSTSLPEPEKLQERAATARSSSPDNSRRERRDPQSPQATRAPHPGPWDLTSGLEGMMSKKIVEEFV